MTRRRARRETVPAVAAFAVVAAVIGLVVRVGVLAAGSRPPRELQLPSRAQLRNGDLIFRSGVSHESHAVTFLDRTSPYSHVGLVDVRGGGAFVIHIEPGNTARESQVRREPLAAFLAPGRADAFAVFHVVPADARLGLAAVDAALRYEARGVSFDHRYDLQTADELYCTELVWRAYREAGFDLLDEDLARASRMHNPMVWLSGLQRSPHVERSEVSADPR